MKRLCTVILVLLCIGYTASAHPGRLDRNGGHYVRTPRAGYAVGEYHYHSGSGKASDDNVIRADSVNNNDIPADENKPFWEYPEIEVSDTDHAYNAGYDTGYDDGYDDGKDAGYKNGKTEGYNKGYDNGHENGYAVGYEAAKKFHVKIEIGVGIAAVFAIGCLVAHIVKKRLSARKG